MSKIINSVKNWFANPKSSTGNSQKRANHHQSDHIISRDRHSVSRKDISENALKVLYRLKKSGYEAFLVGGGVRDILLGLKPKDFDISTNATPEQIKKLFRNCRLVGRRFRLAHILYGRDVIEVATFRAHCDDNIQQGQEGIILRDNVYGTLEEDAIRRDFTVNALYYNIHDFSVHDYCGGLKDLAAKQLRMIGDPETRYREDPVRMLRAVRLSCKLGLSIEESTQVPIKQLAHLLEPVSAARLWEEYRKMFLAGYGHKTFIALQEHGLLQYLFPATKQAYSQDAMFAETVELSLINSDKRVSQDLSLNPAFLLAVFLWQPLLTRAKEMQAKGMGFNDAFFKSMANVLNSQSQHISIPKRYSLVIRDIWAMQLRLPQNYGKKVWQNFEHPRFRAAYDFLVLRSQADHRQKELADWWTEFQEVNPEQRKAMIRQAANQSSGKSASRSKSRKRRRKPKKNNSNASNNKPAP